ncbi:MAG TPA: formate dehydrogenase accessory sulfurtransferase FdhD [Gemmatimonadaceae bacterium]|nr:formate dehydrogenase accessory sulfurtransferase FdhD [Gemmatimonadaceae bacterium]
MIDGIREIEIARSGAGAYDIARDLLAVEEPLEIRVEWNEGAERRVATVAVTMRTPGNDLELAAGFLFTEGIVRAREQIVSMRSCRAGSVRVVLGPEVAIDLGRLERHSFTSSSCGMCGKTSASALRTKSHFTLRPAEPVVAGALLRSLPERLRRAQPAFDATGGLHASALFDLDGRLTTLREDVGRHNALDKVVGAELLAGHLPADERILIVSGRVSFELVQKAVMAGIPIVAAIGAPSSLAVDLARDAGLTLLGFLRSDRFNVYSGGERLVCHPEERSDEGSAFFMREERERAHRAPGASANSDWLES